jgi:hypothetical protein
VSPSHPLKFAKTLSMKSIGYAAKAKINWKIIINIPAKIK